MPEMQWEQKGRWYLESGRYRISKAIAYGESIYTAWKQDGRGWESLKVGTLEECKAVCSRNKEITGNE